MTGQGDPSAIIVARQKRSFVAYTRIRTGLNTHCRQAALHDGSPRFCIIFFLPVSVVFASGPFVHARRSRLRFRIFDHGRHDCRRHPIQDGGHQTGTGNNFRTSVDSDVGQSRQNHIYLYLCMVETVGGGVEAEIASLCQAVHKLLPLPFFRLPSGISGSRGRRILSGVATRTRKWERGVRPSPAVRVTKSGPLFAG